MNIQDWFPLGLTGWISLQCKGLSRVYSNTTIQKHQFFCALLFMVQFSHPYMTAGKTIALTTPIFVSKVIALLFNILPRLVVAFFFSLDKSTLIDSIQLSKIYFCRKMAISNHLYKQVFSKFQCTLDPCPLRHSSPSLLSKLFNNC